MKYCGKSCGILQGWNKYISILFGLETNIFVQHTSSACKRPTSHKVISYDEHNNEILMSKQLVE